MFKGMQLTNQAGESPLRMLSPSIRDSFNCSLKNRVENPGLPEQALKFAAATRKLSPVSGMDYGVIARQPVPGILFTKLLKKFFLNE